MERFRTSVARSVDFVVDPQGGRFNNGIIRGYSLCQVGEALGHGMWCDEFMVGQVQEQLESAGTHGIKSRYTHGNMSADGIEDSLGRTVAAEQDDPTKARGDLHISSMANAEKRRQVLVGADETPEDFGASIVFYRDRKAELDFMVEHGAEIDEDGYLDTSGFKSPDERNTKNLPHTRLQELLRADLVGDPAANRDGMFGEKDSVFKEAQQLLEYALGIGEKPELAQLSLDPEAVKAFAARAITNHWDEIVALRGVEEKPARNWALERKLAEMEQVSARN